MPLTSAIVPVYNEAKTIGQIVEKIHAANIGKEIIIAGHRSTDSTHKY